MAPDEILRDHSPEVRELANRLRRLVHETLIEMSERAYPGWHAIGFRHPRAGYVCGIFPQADSVRFLFEHGRQLSDPEGLLTGDGRQTRHLELRPDDAIPAEGLKILLLEAVALRSR